MSIEDQLRDAADAVNGLWSDPDETQERLAQLQRRIERDPAPDVAPSATEDPRSRPSRRPLSEVVFLTVAETADIMQVSKMTVYRLVRSGHLPAIRVGRSFRVPKQAVHDFVRESDADSESLTVPADRAPQEPRDPGLLTVAEAADVLGISKMQVYRLVHSKVLPAIRTGPTFKVPEPAVQEYRRTAGAPAHRG